MRPKNRRAFTLVELLVILAIVGVLIALVLPAVQKVRLAAARVQIFHSLKQLTLACHTAENAHGRLPPATGSYGELGNKSLSVHLLPFVEQSPIYAAAQSGTAPASVIIPAYTAMLDLSTWDWVRVQNFAANVRVFDDAAFHANYGSVTRRWALSCSQDLTAITDGTSNTILFSTRHANSGAVFSNGAVNCSCYDGRLSNDDGDYLTISGSFPNGTFGPVNFMNFRHVVWCTGTIADLGGLGNTPTHGQWVSCGCKISSQGFWDGNSMELATTYSPIGATYCFAEIAPAGPGNSPGSSAHWQILASAPVPDGPDGGYRTGPTGNAFVQGKHPSLIIFSKVNEPLTSPPGDPPGAFFGAFPLIGSPGPTQFTGWQLAPNLGQTNCTMAGLAHSFTAEGLQVALADGSVRLISAAISAETWNFAMQPNDGHPLNSDW